ncbi:peptide-methionine (S)-S-oxide reductase MsrA [Oceanispirochaeta crateris]|nr:peptide-methionine (S)-S-oxide reductase MsrA [Oceanispirochaeta crateris]
MKKFKKSIALWAPLQLIMMVFMPLPALSASGQSEKQEEAMKSESMDMASEKTMMSFPEGMETAVFAGGCFWGVEAVFEGLQGVENVVSGYSGGSADTASYYSVGAGNTGHAESVEIVFNPETIDFETLLEVFFTVAHDPTQLNYQGPDVGSEYRSVVFYTSEDQKASTMRMIEKLDSQMVFPEKIVTELAPLDTFYPAEDYHQDFMKLNPNHGYIVYWDRPKIVELEKKYPHLLMME